jgi:predicted RNase H-like HicB family nuclease
MTYDYLVMFEQANDGGWGAYVPDLPRLAVGAATREAVTTLIRESIRIYIEELRTDGLPIPEPNSFAERISVAA